MNEDKTQLYRNHGNCDIYLTFSLCIYGTIFYNNITTTNTETYRETIQLHIASKDSYFDNYNKIEENIEDWITLTIWIVPLIKDTELLSFLSNRSTKPETSDPNTTKNRRKCG